MREIVDAMEAWVPYPVYDFIGGPYDGAKLKVTLIRTDDGYIAPEFWNLHEPIKAPTLPTKDVEYKTTIATVSYRFMPVYAYGRRSRSVGHYSYIER